MEKAIGIFDSGIGGVTVLKEILKILPDRDYIYYSDSSNNPYGDKTEEELLKIVDNIINYFIKNNCEIIVFACNTATALTIKKMRYKYNNLTLIGIEPAYKMVYDNDLNKRTLVMATPATINSEKFLNLYHTYNNNNTILLPCSGLANLIEDGNKTDIKKYLKEVLPQKENIEVVVLGCTHYPLIKEEIKSILGDVIFYDGSKGVANRVKELVSGNNKNRQGKVTFYDSSFSKEKETRFYDLLKK